jgi:beta-xylosidase
VPKSEADLSTDQRDEADRIDDLAHALADHFGRKVVLVWPDDKEVVVEPRPERRLDG